jgi:hypothetical protein
MAWLVLIVTPRGRDHAQQENQSGSGPPRQAQVMGIKCVCVLRYQLNDSARKAKSCARKDKSPPRNDRTIAMRAIMTSQCLSRVMMTLPRCHSRSFSQSRTRPAMMKKIVSRSNKNGIMKSQKEVSAIQIRWRPISLLARGWVNCFCAKDRPLTYGSGMAVVCPGDRDAYCLDNHVPKWPRTSQSGVCVQGYRGIATYPRSRDQKIPGAPRFA